MLTILSINKGSFINLLIEDFKTVVSPTWVVLSWYVLNNKKGLFPVADMLT